MKKYLLLVVLVLLGTGLFGGSVQAQSSDYQTEYRETLLELIALLQEQLRLLQSAQDKIIVSKIITTPDSFLNEIDIRDIYRIKESTDVSLVPNQKQKKYFNRVFDLFPNTFDSKIKQLVIFSSDEVEYDAFVETIPPEHNSWLLATNEAILDDVYSDSITELIIHELAHIISYEEIIGVPQPAYQTCDSYFKIHGCPLQNSYLNKFINEFWSATDLDRAERFFNNRDSFDKASDYYSFHSSEYVSDYSALSPEEDFSETFMFYALDLPIEDDATEEKIDFLDSFSQLADLKSEILNNLNPVRN